MSITQYSVRHAIGTIGDLRVRCDGNGLILTSLAPSTRVSGGLSELVDGS